MDVKKNIHFFFDLIQKWLPRVIDFITNQACYSIDLFKAFTEGQSLLQGQTFPLNRFDQALAKSGLEAISAIIVVFKSSAKLCLCSGLKFYSDEKGLDLLDQVQAGKETRTNLTPLAFSGADIFFSYYFNSEGLPTYLQNSQTSSLPCMVYAVP